MSRIIPLRDIAASREKGREKILSLVSEWPDKLGCQEKQEKLSVLFSQRVSPIFMTIENFDPAIYARRHEDDETLKRLLLTAFQAVEEINAVCDLMENNLISAQTHNMYEASRMMVDNYSWDLCRAFYTYVTDGKKPNMDPVDIINLESRLARDGCFPVDLLDNLIMPLRSGSSSGDVPVQVFMPAPALEGAH